MSEILLARKKYVNVKQWYCNWHTNGIDIKMVWNRSRTITPIVISLYPNHYMLHSLNRDIHLRTVGIHKHSQWTLCNRGRKHSYPPQKKRRKYPAPVFSFLCDVCSRPFLFCYFSFFFFLDIVLYIILCFWLPLFVPSNISVHVFSRK